MDDDRSAFDEIGAFYDTHPYPPPVADLSSSMRGWSATDSQRNDHFLHRPTLPFRDDPQILVAGCGTSQAARWAARRPAAWVVGIDVSPSSLEATRELAVRYGLDNLELRELPIEEVAALGRSFDQIVCTGVLHHLADPARGLRALRDVLSPQGALQLMVYGTYGRVGVSMLRDYARMLGIEATHDEIAGLRRVLREIPLGHPMSHVLRNSPDFSDPDALADALLNPRETSYTVPELFALFESSGLRFARWVRQAPYRPSCGIMADLPHADRISAMTDSDQYAAMELFRGTIVRHSLIGYRDDSPFPSPVIDWAGQGWRSFVPSVLDTVVVVDSGLPRGAAAAVINRAHIDSDLICFLDASELAVFAAIDGVTASGAISGASPQLLERLWMHDLIVIDASAV